jgi:hypothetical protein
LANAYVGATFSKKVVKINSRNSHSDACPGPQRASSTYVNAGGIRHVLSRAMNNAAMERYVTRPMPQDRATYSAYPFPYSDELPYVGPGADTSHRRIAIRRYKMGFIANDDRRAMK